MTVYLDHNATTPLDGAVLAAMRPYLEGPYANPSSQHRHGRAARDAVETARAQVAALVEADPATVIFTSGGTEASNLAIKGLARPGERGRFLYGAIEHPSVIEPMKALAEQGFAVEPVAVDRDGRVDLPALEQQFGRGPLRLLSCMAANNETGVIQPIDRVATLAAAAHGLLHVDAVQAAGKIPLRFAGAQLMTLSSHKLYGPKGVGALLVDPEVELRPLLHGGGQEKGLRGGTENVAGIVGFGVAAELARARLAERARTQLALRERLEAALHAIPGLVIFGETAARLPNTVQFAVPGLHSATLLGLLDKQGYALSSGSACASGTDEASHVLLAMGVPHELALGAVRVSLGQASTAAEIDGFVAALMNLLGSLGAAMPAMTRSVPA